MCQENLKKSPQKYFGLAIKVECKCFSSYLSHFVSIVGHLDEIFYAVDLEFPQKSRIFPTNFIFHNSRHS